MYAMCWSTISSLSLASEFDTPGIFSIVANPTTYVFYMDPHPFYKFSVLKRESAFIRLVNFTYNLNVLSSYGFESNNFQLDTENNHRCPDISSISWNEIFFFTTIDGNANRKKSAYMCLHQLKSNTDNFFWKFATNPEWYRISIILMDEFEPPWNLSSWYFNFIIISPIKERGIH